MAGLDTTHDLHRHFCDYSPPPRGVISRAAGNLGANTRFLVAHLFWQERKCQVQALLNSKWRAEQLRASGSFRASIHLTRILRARRMDAFSFFIHASEHEEHDASLRSNAEKC